MLAAADGRLVPEEELDAFTNKARATKKKVDARKKKTDATSHEMVASTEIRIVPPKPFAALSEKDESSVEKIEWTVGEMVASSDFVDEADNKGGASADEGDATNKKVDASIEEMDATLDEGDATDENGK